MKNHHHRPGQLGHDACRRVPGGGDGATETRPPLDVPSRRRIGGVPGHLQGLSPNCFTLLRGDWSFSLQPELLLYNPCWGRSPRFSGSPPLPSPCIHRALHSRTSARNTFKSVAEHAGSDVRFSVGSNTLSCVGQRGW